MKAISSLESPARRPTWVDAAPFRAHVRHAMNVADVPWPAVAVAAGVSVPAVRALLGGRAGRPQARVEPRLAARLLRVDAGELIAMRSARVPSALTAERLRHLLADGVDPLRMARWCQIAPDELTALVDGDATSCSRLTEALVLAAQRLRDAGPQQPGVAA